MQRMKSTKAPELSNIGDSWEAQTAYNSSKFHDILVMRKF